MRNFYLNSVFLLFLAFTSCRSVNEIRFTAGHEAFRTFGLVVQQEEATELVSSASGVEFRFSGSSCRVLLSNQASGGDYNYAVFELDGNYHSRVRVDQEDPVEFEIMAVDSAKEHLLRIYKATEAQNGLLLFHGANCEDIVPAETNYNLKIEFIGNSITCGMGNDVQEIPCESGKWLDQHNAWYSYASLTARALNAEPLLSSVSGAGIYRAWNSDQPTVPSLYWSAYLNSDSLLKRDFSKWKPDLIVVALGTNDLSLGDGTTARAPFDSARFVREYLQFIDTLSGVQPQARFVMLTSPMVSGENEELLFRCLLEVQTAFSEKYPGAQKPEIHRFPPITATGCSGHPNKEEHRLMAESLTDFLKNLLLTPEKS